MRTSSAPREMLGDIAEVEVAEDASDAALLRAVVEAGIKAVERQLESAGYAEIAADFDGRQRKAAARRRPSWAEE